MLNDSTGLFIAYLNLEVWKSSQGLRLWWRVSVSGAQAINKNVYVYATHSLNNITCIACNQIKVMYSTLSNLIQAHHIISNITKRWKLITSILELYFQVLAFDSNFKKSNSKSKSPDRNTLNARRSQGSLSVH